MVKLIKIYFQLGDQQMRINQSGGEHSNEQKKM